MNKFCHKLNRIKNHYIKWNKDVFGNIFQNTKLSQCQADEAKKKFFQDPSPLNFMEMNKSTAALIAALNIEETSWKQNASIKWLREGERNTIVFQNFVKDRRDRNVIQSITDDNNLISTGDEMNLCLLDITPPLIVPLLN